MDIATAGLILYWCEGSKREEDRRVEFVNSDPKMVAVFMKYLRSKDIIEERIRARLTIHVQDNEPRCKDYWKTVTALNDSNFIKTVVKAPSFSKRPLPYGVVAIRYNSLRLLRQIKGEIANLAEELVDSDMQKSA